MTATADGIMPNTPTLSSLPPRTPVYIVSHAGINYLHILPTAGRGSLGRVLKGPLAAVVMWIDVLLVSPSTRYLRIY